MITIIIKLQKVKYDIKCHIQTKGGIKMFVFSSEIKVEKKRKEKEMGQHKQGVWI